MLGTRPAHAKSFMASQMRAPLPSEVLIEADLLAPWRYKAALSSMRPRRCGAGAQVRLLGGRGAAQCWVHARSRLDLAKSHTS